MIDESQEGKSFVCPNCGGCVPGDIANISRVGPTDDPWSRVLQTIDCALCRHTIPAHLGERWNNRPIEDARKEWLEVYKK